MDSAHLVQMPTPTPSRKGSVPMVLEAVRPTRSPTRSKPVDRWVRLERPIRRRNRRDSPLGRVVSQDRRPFPEVKRTGYPTTRT